MRPSDEEWAYRVWATKDDATRNLYRRYCQWCKRAKDSVKGILACQACDRIRPRRAS